MWNHKSAHVLRFMHTKQNKDKTLHQYQTLNEFGFTYSILNHLDLIIIRLIIYGFITEDMLFVFSLIYLVPLERGIRL